MIKLTDYRKINHLHVHIKTEKVYPSPSISGGEKAKKQVDRRL